VSKKKVFAVLCLSLLLGIFSSQRARIFFRESGSFLYALVKNPKRIGAVIPSSSFLSSTIVKKIEKKDNPIKILEVGAGTGAFTEKIVQKMGDQDLLDVIELDSNLCDILRKKFGTHKNVKIHCLSILDFKTDNVYDFIISGLPFNAFGSDLVSSIVNKYKHLIKNNGIVSYFEYMLTANIRKFFSMGKKRVDFVRSMKILENFRKKFLIERNRVFLNVPPAYTYHLQIKK